MKKIKKYLTYTGIALTFGALIVACGYCVWYTAQSFWNLINS